LIKKNGCVGREIKIKNWSAGVLELWSYGKIKHYFDSYDYGKGSLGNIQN
jgi:hypothetical protein